LTFDELESEYIKNWVNRNKQHGEANGKAVYYTLYDDNIYMPMEMYLFMPSAKEIMGDITLSNIKITESGAAIILNINAKNNIKRTKESTDLILHVTGSHEDAEARTERLVINGVTYTCPGATFTRLR
jgi:hypothetical protein